MTSIKSLRDAKRESYMSQRSMKSLNNKDDILLKELGYVPTLDRYMFSLDSLALTVSCVNPFFFILFFAFSLTLGGPAPTWSNWIIGSMGMLTIAATFGELAALYPTCGSIYYWSYRSGGKDYGPVFAFLTAVCNILGTLVSTSGGSIAIFNFIITEVVVFYPDFNVDPSTLSFRAIQFAGAVVVLAISCFANLLNTKVTIWIIRSIVIIFIWMIIIHWIYLPIAVLSNPNMSFNSASYVFTSFYNGNGTNDISYNWFVNFSLPCYSIIGFEAAAHVSEETKNAAKSSASGIFRGCFLCAFLGFCTILVLLFTFDVTSTTLANSPAPIVGLYLDAMGQTNQLIVMIFIVLGFILGSISWLYGMTRFIFAVSRDGFIPEFLSVVDHRGIPVNSIYAIFIACSFFLCFILVDPITFNILSSAGSQLFMLSYFFVIIGRVTITFSTYKQSSEWSLGSLSYPIAFLAVLWICFVFIIFSLPDFFPLTPKVFNYSPFIVLILVAISLVAWNFSVKHSFKGLGKQNDEQLRKSFMERTGSFLSCAEEIDDNEMRIVKNVDSADDNGLRLRSPRRMMSPRLFSKSNFNCVI